MNRSGRLRRTHRASRRMMPSLLFPLLAAILAGCCRGGAPEMEPDYDRELPPGTPALELVPFGEIPDFDLPDAARRGEIVEAIGRSLNYLRKPSAKASYPVQAFTHERAIRTLEALRELLGSAEDQAALQQAILDRFDVYRSVGWDGSGEVLYTGYYSPVFDASRTRAGPYRYPLYRRPPDLALGEGGSPMGRRLADGTVGPYPTRRQIEEGHLLEGKDLEIAWLRDPFEAYIVHVQGSAILRLSEGGELRVGYHGKTDRSYASVAEALLRSGKITKKQRSLQGMRAHFRAHPEDLSYLFLNESYVFFTESQGGPFGSINERVSGYVTLALDRNLFPRGAACFADTQVPTDATGETLRPFRQFMLNQDTGGAIRSAGRADIYTGIGDHAEAIAGQAQQVGRLYFLLLKE
ncbi:MAG: MltA domain-containing protein [Planctomycetes bacterium]|nr:MltA domain-containing protein [Planctomycetota bacterium]